NDVKTTNAAPATQPLKLSLGWTVVGALGYKDPSHFRGEVEFAYGRNGQGTLGTTGGSSTLTGGFANVYYDIPMSKVVTLSIGGGIGAASVHHGVHVGATDYINDSAMSFAW